ncbi:MAG TPA: oxaloacetate-decarboxylating malate dehydrogenase, partial [Deinococcales bacterium]|nr:oxaloacetate-decarboxylating malate dehydrogenase [Deinococcales bacterium]
SVTGFQLLHLPLLNKGTAFTEQERTLLDLHGLLPPRIDTLDQQIERNYRRFEKLGDPLEQHTFLRQLQDSNEVLFFALVQQHLDEMLPVIYTPTVGEAVRKFSSLYQSPRGLILSVDSIGYAKEAVDNIPLDDVRMIVATDASAILGIGDQGLGGMAISIGKLAIYTTAGGIGPDKVLPVELDVGTNRGSLREDPDYLGVDRARLTGKPYRNFIDSFVETVVERYPKTVIQWEDFAKETAFAVLERYRNVVPSFNDDIQGTGAMALAGVLSACRIKEEDIADQRFVITGAGAGGIGVAELIIQGLMQAGLERSEALERVLVLDSRGVLRTDRELEAYKQPYAQDPEFLTGLGLEGDSTLGGIVTDSGATVLIGLSGQGGQFTREVVDAVSANTDRPVIFPLSNPTDNTEVLPATALAWTDG